jgi:hypothetical protein
MEEVRTSETSVDSHFTRQYIPEDNSEHHTRRRENFKSNIGLIFCRLTVLGGFKLWSVTWNGKYFSWMAFKIPFRQICWRL